MFASMRLQHRVGPAVRQCAERGELDRLPCRVDVGERRAPELEDEARVPRGARRRPGCGRVRPRARTAPDADEGLRLEDPERLAQGRARHAEVLHQRALGRERVTFLQLAPDDLTPQVRGHEFGGLRDAHRSGDVGHTGLFVHSVGPSNGVRRIVGGGPGRPWHGALGFRPSSRPCRRAAGCR